MDQDRISLPRKAFALPIAIAGALPLLLGLTVIAGWLLHVPALVEIKSGLVPMVFNTALCFTMSGTAVLSAHSPAVAARRLRLGTGVALLLLCGATLIELSLDRNLGVDLPFLHDWYDYGNTRPGRMAPNTALGFMLIGATLVLADRVASRRRALAVVLLSFAVLAIGLTGLAGYLLAPDLLFGWARSARMALHTASGMIVTAIGLWLSWSGRDWYASRRFFREDEKIRFLGVTVLFVVAVTVGLTGFVLLQASLEKTLESNLEATVGSRKPWFHATVRDAWRYSASAARLGSLDEAGIALLQASAPAKEARYRQIADRIGREGFRGIALQDANGKPLQTTGQFVPEPELAASLDRDGRSWLIWDGELVLRSVVPLQFEGKDLGRLTFDLAAPQLNDSLFNATQLGKTGEIGACLADGKELQCFPANVHDRPFRLKPRAATGRPMPIELALAGKSGIVYTLDYRGQNVIAAYAPMTATLGYVVKQDTKEAYAAIRDTLKIGTPIILLVAVLGAVLLNSQLHPLITRMRALELAQTRLAHYDSLTGLPNRFLFMDLLQTAVSRSKRTGTAMALMFLDLDGFKQVNDTMGHAAGDQLLIQFAQRLKALTRQTDTVARLAGDEFTVVLESLSHPEDDVRLVADKILAAVREPFPINAGQAKVTVSIGTAILRASEEELDPEQLLHRADQGMYAAKQGGKNAHTLA